MGKDNSLATKLSVIAKGSNTSNLKSHLTVHHLLHYTVLRQKAQDEKTKKDKPSKATGESRPTITSAMEEQKKYETSLKKWKQLTDTLTYYSKRHASCLKESFKKLEQTFDSQYQLPSRKYFSTKFYNCKVLCCHY